MNSELISQTINYISDVKLLPNLKSKNKLEKTLQNDNIKKSKKKLSKSNKNIKNKEKIEIDQDELNYFSVDKENERIRMKELFDFYDEVSNCTQRLENKIDSIDDKSIKDTVLSQNDVNNDNVSDIMIYLKNQSTRNQQNVILSHYIEKGFKIILYILFNLQILFIYILFFII